FIRDLVGRPAAAFVGAAVFTFANPLVEGFLTAGQAQKLAAEWLPLYFFALFRALRSTEYRVPGTELAIEQSSPRNTQHATNRTRYSVPGTRYSLLAVLVLIITSLTDWQYVLY